MLFNSLEYIFLFLPIVIAGYFIIGSWSHSSKAQNLWLVSASFFFYSYWKIEYLPLLLLSITINYLVSQRILAKGERSRLYLVLGVVFNLLLLGVFKYTDFILENVFLLIRDPDPPLLNFILPLGISFFTFQQIAFLIDCSRSQANEQRILPYSLFVSFFPQLIAGPIVHHKEMMPQFEARSRRSIQWENLSLGLFIFSMGLFKKVAIADTLAPWVNQGFAQPEQLSFVDAWATCFWYTFQLYFDFSGYSDMAIGAARMLNINLPINFNSPYKAYSIQDFWRRWHMTLSRWLRDYLYIPLGGNRRGPIRNYINLFLTFLLAGLWHGAAWTFVLWGAMHGVALVLHRFISRSNWLHLPRGLAVVFTFLFVAVAWVPFRAESLTSAWAIGRGMLGMNGVAVPQAIADQLQTLLGVVIPNIQVATAAEPFGIWAYLLLPILFVVVFFPKNTMEVAHIIEGGENSFLGYKPNLRCAACTALAMFISLLSFFGQVTRSEFLYFNF
ncbi:MBOAT family protein [Oceanidesulfovibrio indonesiensis]|uniref:MBOAT family protein n=1 Tax=Oceanidesulfovibrio indonesiensis TaxID=54767 RepID=A0A7M3MEH4_9BACT|nr:MBOAT family protein [Oceanidesulfovibrio indonesiensis]TVM17296.1 MBOAT family protein [Oceanidesulfovibrio indonesiensis]